MGDQVKLQILTPGNFNQADVDKLKSGRIWKVVDIYQSQLAELAEIRYPASADKQKEFVSNAPKDDLAGAWVYYPWSGELLHCVGEKELFELRTNRNQNLITNDEQQKLASSSIAVAGMSVGSGIALACVYSGISRSLKIADFDNLETANLNRLHESLTSIGEAKTDLTARHIWGLDPFATVDIFDKAINSRNIDEFFRDTTVVVDEIDDFKMKVRLRLKAKEQQIPLLMLTSLGDNILIDIERYDLDPNLTIFNGAIGDVPEEILAKGAISAQDTKKYAVALVGPRYVPTKAMTSLVEIGKTLVGRPQLYSTIAVDGGLAAYIIKMILLGAPVKSGRYFVKFTELVGLKSADLTDSPLERQAIIKELMGNG